MGNTHTKIHGKRVWILWQLIRRKIRKGKDDTLEDFYTYGLTVLAPCAGRVIKVIKHLEDNKLGEVDTKNNWGNLVVIEHTPFCILIYLICSRIPFL